jgi:protocatechuate 3,4-dioxygenase beta subunit
MKRLLLLLIFSGLACHTVVAQAASQSAASPAPRKQDECHLTGMVVKLAGSEPLRKAHLRLQSVDDRTHSVTVVTDESGRFEFKRIDPGRYNLTAMRVGFVSLPYGQRKDGDPGAILTLMPGQEMKDLLFRLVPSGVLAGRIFDEDGDPLPGVNVSALREAYSEGKRKLGVKSTVETDDLGQYRLYGLAPGHYFVSAVYPYWRRVGGEEDNGVETSGPEGYARLYYPGTADQSKASAFTIKAGEEIPSVDMPMRLVPVFTVRGHVYNQITHRPGKGTMVFMLPKTLNIGWDGGMNRADVDKADGSFEVHEVIPGTYELTALWFDQGKEYTSTATVEVSGGDVGGISLFIQPGASVNGQVVWEGPPALDKDDLTIMPRLGESDMVFNGPTRVAANNSFVLKDLGDGTYRAAVSGFSKDCYVKEIEYAGNSAIDDGFTVARSSDASLKIVISSRGARLQGAVTDADGLPAVGVYVVIVPNPPHRAINRLYKHVLTDQNGHFDLRGIAPGDYAVFSWDEVEEGAWEDPEFLKPFEDKGEKIAVQDGDVKAMSLLSIKTAITPQDTP